MTEANTIAVLTSLISIMGALLVAYVTAWLQVVALDKTRSTDRRFALYDQAIEMIMELEKRPALSLDDAFLSRWYLLAGRFKVYGSKTIVDLMVTFADRLRCNRADYEVERIKLHDQWFVKEDVVSEDGNSHDVLERFLGAEYWEYEDGCTQLCARWELPAGEIGAAAEQIVSAIRKECGIG